jgi:hypothetical protein
MDELAGLELALALSRAEAEEARGAPPPRAPPPDLAADAELARRLQAELDAEAARAPRAPPPPPNPGRLATDEALARRLQELEAAAAPPPLPPAAAPLQRWAPPSVPQDCCAGCAQPLRPRLGGLFGGGGASARYITALGANWHPQCFTCAAPDCRRPLEGSFSIGEHDGAPRHATCHKISFHPRCNVCAGYLPEEGGGRRIVWSVTPFWNEKSCPRHQEDGTAHCTSCQRLEPRGAGWARLSDGRALCLPCLGTAIADTTAAQPLYDDVLAFFASLGIPLPARPPLALVDAGALNARAVGAGRGGGGGGAAPEGAVFHTRGLCLTEYSTPVRTVVRGPAGLLGGLFGAAAGAETHEVSYGPTSCAVTAILVLFGLPRLLTGAILAHECMHASLRLAGFAGLAPQVEEGLCQLAALLWLEAQDPGAAHQQPGADAEARAFLARLHSFLGQQIRTDTSVIYGDGFRMAHDAFQHLGLRRTLEAVRATGALP